LSHEPATSFDGGLAVGEIADLPSRPLQHDVRGASLTRAESNREFDCSQRSDDNTIQIWGEAARVIEAEGIRAGVEIHAQHSVGGLVKGAAV
jgi:hypothetical protein